MSREPGREGTEASEAWREAGRDMVVESGGWAVRGAASVVVRRFRAAEGQPRLSSASHRASSSASAAVFLVCLIC